jgi:hypothetical protein
VITHGFEYLKTYLYVTPTKYFAYINVSVSESMITDEETYPEDINTN